MANYSSKFTARNTAFKNKWARGRESAFGFARFGIARFGYPKTIYASKFLAKSNVYVSKFS